MMIDFATGMAISTKMTINTTEVNPNHPNPYPLLSTQEKPHSSSSTNYINSYHIYEPYT